MDKNFDYKTTYDIQYLERMWQIVIPYYNLKLWTQGKSVNVYQNFSTLYQQMKKRLGLDYIATATLTNEDYKYIKNAVNEKEYHTYLPFLLKPINPLKKEDFLNAYSLLKNKHHKEIVENIIKTQNGNYANINSEEYVPFHTKNIKIILDAFDITVAELDRQVFEESSIQTTEGKTEPDKHMVSKIINKRTHEIMDERKLQVIATSINKIIEKKYRESNVRILKEDYYDDSFRWVNLFTSQSFSYEKETYEFYKDYPILTEDIEKSRILYSGEDNKYYAFEMDWLTQAFKKLDKSQKKIIIDLIYEFLYEEYKIFLKKLIQNILEKHGVNIKEYEEKWGKIPENIPDFRFIKIIIAFSKIK